MIGWPTGEPTQTMQLTVPRCGVRGRAPSYEQPGQMADAVIRAWLRTTVNAPRWHTRWHTASPASEGTPGRPVEAEPSIDDDDLQLAKLAMRVRLPRRLHRSGAAAAKSTASQEAMLPDRLIPLAERVRRRAGRSVRAVLTARPRRGRDVCEACFVPDGLWQRNRSGLPPPKPRRYRYPRRRPIDDRAALAGIVFGAWRAERDGAVRPARSPIPARRSDVVGPRNTPFRRARCPPRSPGHRAVRETSPSGAPRPSKTPCGAAPEHLVVARSGGRRRT